MDAELSNLLPAFGFLTVLECPQHGFFGGYLVLSPQGRPLEFRCSTPVAPSRAQEILFGPSLRPYILAEVIGQALTASAATPVAVILTDHRDVLPLAMLCREPVALVEDAPAAGAGATSDAAIELGGVRLALHRDAATSVAEVASRLAPLLAHVDLREPFERIRAALAEAQLASSDAADLTDDRVAA